MWASFTLEQAMEAQKRLRACLGPEPEVFPVQAFVSDEIEQMRNAGRSDLDIIQIVHEATGVQLSSEDFARFYALPEIRAR